MNSLQSRARAKVVLKAPVSIKADRCWQKGKGEGETGEGGSKGKGWPKGKRSNSGHTWDNAWHHSNWHGKTYGLEVDPWTAVEPVPYLCAISLKSSCEEFSEPKHVSGDTHQNSAVWESKGFLLT